MRYNPDSAVLSLWKSSKPKLSGSFNSFIEMDLRKHVGSIWVCLPCLAVHTCTHHGKYSASHGILVLHTKGAKLRLKLPRSIKKENFELGTLLLYSPALYCAAKWLRTQEDPIHSGQ